MSIRLTLKNENETVGVITHNFEFHKNKEYSGIIPYPINTSDNILEKDIVMKFLETRTISKDNYAIENALKHFKLLVYDPLAIIAKTHGQMSNDHLWLAFNECEKWEDISYDLNIKDYVPEEFDNFDANLLK